MGKDIIFTQVLQWWNKCFFLTIIRTSNIFIILQHWFITLFGVLVTVKVIQFMKLFEIAEVVEITFKTITWEKNSRKRCYFYSGITMMKLQLTLNHYLLTDEKLFELFPLKMIFPNTKCCNLFIFIYHLMVIPQNDTFLYYWTNQISLCCIILWNAFLAPK